MRQGKVKAALRLLDNHTKGGVLLLNDTIQANSNEQTVRDVLFEKHPNGQPAHPDTLLQPPTTTSDVHPVLFDRLDGEMIRHIALQTDGSAGPSGVDSHGWRRMCTSFKKASTELCNSVAIVARRISTTLVDPVGLSPLIACRLIALDKCPGVRPIGIGETARRIIGKAILHIVREDIQEVAGSSQLCAGQKSGSEAAVHAIRKIFKKEETEAVLEIDATNAFNRLNRQSTLQNIRVLCPSLATTLINTYRNNAELFIDGECVSSKEGTTQGDPLAMAMYALGILPLIRKLDHLTKQVWFADDATAGGKLNQLRKWWDEIILCGPSYGYFANPSKTWLIVKPDHLSAAQEIFRDTGVNITSEGRRHLGAAIGSASFVKDYMNEKVKTWVEEVTKLASIATTHPQEAYAALTHGLTSKWTYFMRTIPNINNLLQPLEDAIRLRLIPAITGKSAINDLERDLFSLPTRLGGLNIPNPMKISPKEYDASVKVTAALVEAINQQTGLFDHPMIVDQTNSTSEVRKEKRKTQLAESERLRPLLSQEHQKLMDMASEKGSSSWLAALPIESHGFSLHKGAFRDAISLRYGWLPSHLPSKCICGKSFTVDHALNCPTGGFPTIRHNEIRDLTAKLMTEICHDVCVEPPLQPLSGEHLPYATANRDENARLDIKARGFWGVPQQCAYFDVRVFNPHSTSYRGSELTACYRRHEGEKRRAYEHRVREVEQGSFTPLVFSTSGGMGRAATVAYKRLATLIAAKREQPYSSVMGWLRCHLSFSLLRSTVMCLRGSRSRQGFVPRIDTPVDLVIRECRIPT